jgi:RNA polymerase sigma-70 factor (ECF subfamily)
MISTITTRGEQTLAARALRSRPSKLSPERAAERQLVLRASKRDRQAFATLYDMFADKIYRYIYYKVGNKPDAEDLTSQVFMKSWQAIAGYQWTDRPFVAWLYRIAHNLVVDHFRTHRDASPLDEMVTIETGDPGPEAKLEDCLTQETVRNALTRLTHDQQQVVILRFLEGYSTAEVAAIMGKQEGAVRTLQHRALAGLKQVFQNSRPEF